MRILVVNRGSSSLKYADFDEGARRGGAIERLDPGEDGLARLVDAVGALDRFDVVGHRVVHGGPDLVEPARVGPELLAKLRAITELDPTHLAAEIALIESVAARAPTLAQIVAFDTAFHARMPRAARLLPIPLDLAERGVRRYGFHGLSYEHLMDELERVAGPDAARGRVVLAHLGSGASLAALRDGRPVDTTMSFTPNSGVVMGTRSGDLDPGVVLHLARTGLSIDAIDEMLSRRSGMAGLSGGTSDMRDLLAREHADGRASDAIEVFCRGIRKAVGALAATIDGLDTLVFSAGIGERAPLVRARIAAGLGHLGVRIDPALNAVNAAVVSAKGAAVCVRVIPADEESVIARAAARLARSE